GRRRGLGRSQALQSRLDALDAGNVELQTCKSRRSGALRGVLWMDDQGLLRRIDAKLGALLAIVLDEYLRETGVAKPRPRSVDRLLADAGLTTREIAAILGKTDRAVQMVLQSGRVTTRKRSDSRLEEPPEQ